MSRVNFSDRRVAGFKSGSNTLAHWDSAVPGLGLRISPKGTKTWVIYYEQTRSRRKIGRYPAMGLAVARQQARDKLLQAQLGEDPFDEIGESFAEVAEHYLEIYSAREHSKNWHYEIRRVLNKRILPAFGSKPTASIRRRDIVGLLDKAANSGPASANQVRAILSGIFGWAVNRDLAEFNPVQGIKKVGKSRPRERVLTDSEIKLVWAACEKDATPISISTQLVLVTAQRGGEVRALRWEQIDGDWWTIPRTKAGRSHRVFLSPLAHELLERLEKTGGYCFPASTGTSGYLVRPYKALYRLRDLSGIHDWTIHDLRRTAATQMASMGIRREVLRQVLGHADHSVTGIYDRASYDEDKKRAMIGWDARLREHVR